MRWIARAAPVALIATSLLACAGHGAGEAAPVEAEAALAGGGRRLDLRFPCGTSRCAGWLFLPAAEQAPPIVAMAHGFAGTREVALPFFAERFAAAGLASFVFDYRHFGASGGEPRQLVDPWRQLDDWRAALAFLRERDDVDGDRLALWGTSQGGGHALIVAAEDPRVRAVVAQAPLVDTRMEGEATFYGAAWAARLLLSAWADLARSAFRADALTIPAMAPAGGFGVIVDDAAFAAFERLSSGRHRNAVAARSVLTFDSYDPREQARALSVPALLVASREDRFAPFAAAEAFAREHPNASLAEIGGDHFDVYAAPVRERAAGLAVDFLQRALAR
jgi:pimeloyl-ACP methyl ester carboxylesterase